MRIAGDGDFGAGSIVMVHGIMSTYGRFTEVANDFVNKKLYRNVYALSYDWRMPSSQAAHFLAQKLDEVQAQGKKVDILGHSKGVLVCRYALEVLGKTKAVRNAYLLCGPNEGTLTTDLGELIAMLFEDALNSKFTILDLLPDPGVPAVQELAYNSQFTRDLNSHRGQRGVVNYVLSGGGADWIVDERSELAEDVTLEEVTGGTILRQGFPSYGHETILETPDGVKRLEQLIQSTGGPAISIWTDPSSTDVRGDGCGWDYGIRVRNASGGTIMFHDLSMELYDRTGQWETTQWYDPSTPGGDLFPFNSVPLDVQLLAGEQYADIDVHTRADADDNPLWDVPAQNQAVTGVFIARGVDATGKTIEASCQVQLHYGDIWPSPPDTRSRGRGTPGVRLTGRR